MKTAMVIVAAFASGAMLMATEVKGLGYAAAQNTDDDQECEDCKNLVKLLKEHPGWIATRTRRLCHASIPEKLTEACHTFADWIGCGLNKFLLTTSPIKICRAMRQC